MGTVDERRASDRRTAHRAVAAAVSGVWAAADPGVDGVRVDLELADGLRHACDERALELLVGDRQRIAVAVVGVLVGVEVVDEQAAGELGGPGALVAELEAAGAVADVVRDRAWLGAGGVDRVGVHERGHASVGGRARSSPGEQLAAGRGLAADQVAGGGVGRAWPRCDPGMCAPWERLAAGRRTCAWRPALRAWWLGGLGRFGRGVVASGTRRRCRSLRASGRRARLAVAGQAAVAAFVVGEVAEHAGLDRAGAAGEMHRGAVGRGERVGHEVSRWSGDGPPRWRALWLVDWGWALAGLSEAGAAGAARVVAAVGRGALPADRVGEPPRFVGAERS